MALPWRGEGRANKDLKSSKNLVFRRTVILQPLLPRQKVQLKEVVTSLKGFLVICKPGEEFNLFNQHFGAPQPIWHLHKDSCDMNYLALRSNFLCKKFGFLTEFAWDDQPFFGA